MAPGQASARRTNRSRRASVRHGPARAAAVMPWRRPPLLVGHNVVCMRLVIATCAVDYQGRLSAHLPSATRLLMVKADGSVSVHSDDRAYKPLNWMAPPCELSVEESRWVVTNPKGETLTITIAGIHLDV